MWLDTGLPWGHQLLLVEEPDHCHQGTKWGSNSQASPILPLTQQEGAGQEVAPGLQGQHQGIGLISRDQSLTTFQGPWWGTQVGLNLRLPACNQMPLWLPARPHARPPSRPFLLPAAHVQPLLWQ